jgi:putative colanic acid biosynthesis UDP-glucose lipid carrier transferase
MPVANRQGGLIRPFQSELSLVHRIMDGLWIVLILVGLTASFDVQWTEQYTAAAASAVALFFFFGESNGLYRSWRGETVTYESLQVLLVWFWMMLGLLFIGYATKTSAIYSRRVLLTWMVVGPSVLILWRMGIRSFLRVMRAKGRNTRTAAVAGSGAIGKRVAEALEASPWMGIRFVGYFDEDGFADNDSEAAAGETIVGDFDSLIDTARSGGVDIVYIAAPMRAESRIRGLVERLADTPAAVYLVPDFFVFNLLRSRLVSVGDIPAVSVFDKPLSGLEGWLKRSEDLVLGVSIMALMLVPMVLISLAVKLSSPGPVLFKQRRYGLDGREIVVWKFRTMTVCEDEDVVTQARRNDPRVTYIGRFLRLTSLDELPQFVNVLRGDMSIVGPRPHAVAHNEEYRKLIQRYMVRHKIKPGITGWAQINGWRGETDTLEKMERRVEYDLEYIQNWSLWLDLKIILLTLVRGFWHRNAY